MIFSKAQMYKGHVQTEIPGRFSRTRSSHLQKCLWRNTRGWRREAVHTLSVEKYPRLEERGLMHPYLGWSWVRGQHLLSPGS